MTLVPVDPVALVLKERRWAYRKAMRIVEEFVDSDHDAVELVWDANEYTNAASVSSCYAKAARKLHADVFVTTRGDKVYLVRRHIMEV